MNAKSMIWNRYTLLILLAVTAGAGYLYWNKQQGVVDVNRYRMAKVERGDLAQTVSANGTLNPVVLVSVGTQVSGTVKKLYVDFNDRVQKGQRLMELEPALFQAQVMQSEANVRNAQAALDLAQANEARSRGLYAKEYIAKQDYDTSVQAMKSAAAQLDLTKAQLQRDRTNLGYSVIRSPVSGVVVDRVVDLGQTVAASFQTPTLFKIAQDLKKMQIDSSFAEADIGNIRVGQKVRFSVDAFAGRSFDAVVKQLRLNPTNLQNVVTYNVVVNVDNPEQILLPGMTAYVNITVAERKSALLLPNEALRFHPKVSEKSRGGGKKSDKDGQSAKVYVLENGQPRQVRIRVGITDNKMTEVISGLKEGDSVIAEDISDSGDSGDKGQSNQGPPRMRMF